MFDAGPLPHEPIEPWRSFKRKLDREAARKERLKALGAFTAIAIGAIAGFEMVIGGGFDFINLGPEVREVAPSRYVAVYQEPWSPEARVVQLSSTEPLFAGEYVRVDTPSDRLAGAYDNPATPGIAFPEIDEDELYRQIEALYANDAGPAYEEAPISYEEAPAIDEPREQQPSQSYVDAQAMIDEALAGYKPSQDLLQPS